MEVRSLEERAKAYEEEYPNMDNSWYSYYVRDGYIKGAKDQREIDIEKAQKVHCDICGCKITCQICPDKDRIRKAMMEEK